jgi:selenocysteine-specific elongation factor
MEIVKKILSKDAFKMAVNRDEIRFSLMPNLDDELFELMLRELCDEEKLTRTEAGYRIPNFVVRLPSYREKLIERLVEFAKSLGYGTFSAGTYWKLHGEGDSFRDVKRFSIIFMPKRGS